MRSLRFRSLLVVACSLLLAGCFQFRHKDRDHSSRPERAIGSAARVVMPGESSVPMAVFGQPDGHSGGGTTSSQGSGPTQSGSSSQHGAPPAGGGGADDDGMVMIGGVSGEADASNRERKIPIVGPLLTLIGYPFWIFGKSNEEKVEQAAAERAKEHHTVDPGSRTPDDTERTRLAVENERIRRQLEQASAAPARSSSISDELAALERSLGSRSAAGSPPRRTAPTPTTPAPRETREGVDRNRDGRPDLWAVRDGDRVVREELDENHDGVVDRILYYDDDHRVKRAEEDLDGDGSMETISHYSQGEIARRRADSNGDGQSDSWSFYEGGELVRHEVDRDADGFRDLIMLYEAGELFREEDDRNRDGRPDLVSRYGHGGELLEKTEDLDYDGLPDITSYYEHGKLVRRSVSSEGALESWSETSGS